MTQRWHVRRGTDVHGPFTTQECIEFRAEGRLQDHDEVRPDNATTWIQAGTVQLFQSQVDTMRMTPPPLPFVRQEVAYAPPPRRLMGVTVTVSVGIVAFVGLVVRSNAWYLEVLHRADGGAWSAARDAARQAEAYEGLQVLIWLATAVAFMVWMHRGYANLEGLHQRRKHGLGWVIGGWFVPFYNVYKPGAIGIDLERQSAEACGASAKARWAFWWWGLFVGRILLLSVNAQIGSKANVNSTTIEVLIWVELLVAIGLGLATLGFLFSVARKQGVAISAHGSRGS